ncbi:ChbG/HpnK family deacetylase [Asanoa siamensis]|uniref:Chitooligosaccharide deacetylase n=1 Tax=Asanoa siamensis TaxID=926357 RepID=A0ABQ4CLE0_9ACTN|nr:ChbG/HpnK family deacetylase [Asanoa siamensis]GIF72108.1 chitooligosaccharide deacetylase [Asanoa siamensis]
MTRRLIVNADDYGLSEELSRGVLAAHDRGVVTGTSVLAVGPAVGTAAGWLRDRPALDVGAHLALVGEDPPLLSPREVPTLVDRRGRFPLRWRAFLLAAVTGRVDPADVRREFAAQLDRLTRDLRLTLTHVDTHQHLHLFPPVGRIVTDLAVERGIPAVRLPTSAARGPQGAWIRHWSRALAGRLRAAGLAFPAAYGGLDEAGGLTLDRARELVTRLAAGPAPVIEINCHPGTPSAADRARYAWGYRWEEELDALTNPALRAEVADLGLTLSGWRALTAR